MSTPTIISIPSAKGQALSLFQKICGREPIAFLFECTAEEQPSYSFLGFGPIKTISFEQGKATVSDFRIGSKIIVEFSDPLALLEQHLKMEEEHFIFHEALADCPFRGGWMGYMGYGATQYFDNIPQQPNAPFKIAEAFYGLYDTFLVFNHLLGEITFVSYREETEGTMLFEILKNDIGADLFEDEPIVEAFESDREIHKNVYDSVGQKQFELGVEQAKHYITEGEAFQIVLSHRFSLPISCEPLDIYPVLKALNPSDYCYYLQIHDTVYVGASPEAFVRSINGMVSLQALAGTRQRGATSTEDEQLAIELKSNEKELAEHYMLIDLARNDLGRVCEIGSVGVGEIAKICRYHSVMHLATEVTGKLKQEKTVYDLFRSCFPAGTVTGAPKIRAMQLISSLEPEQRGIYSGVVGYFDVFGNMDGALAIRSAVVQDRVAHVNVGAGIVYDSDPTSEYFETKYKSRSILYAIQVADRFHSHSYQADPDVCLTY